jgi:flagellar FliL protein
MADRDEKPAPESETKPAGKGGAVKWVLIGVGAFVLATLSQAVAPIFTLPLMEKLAQHKAAKEAEALAEKEHPSRDPPAEPIYAPLNPPMVVNLANDPSGFLQVEIQVMARDAAIIDAVKANEPAVRGALLMLLAGKTREDVTTREGKEQLRSEVLSEVQRVIGPYTNDHNVEDVYFTSLIAQ